MKSFDSWHNFVLQQKNYFISALFLLFTLSLHPCCRLNVKVQKQEQTTRTLNIALPLSLSRLRNIKLLGDRYCRPANKLSQDLSVLWCREDQQFRSSIAFIETFLCQELWQLVPNKKRKVQSFIPTTFCGAKIFYPRLMTLLFIIRLLLVLCFPWIVKLQWSRVFDFQFWRNY